MGKYNVVIARELVEDFLATGYSGPSFRVVSGIPPDARLESAGILGSGDLCLRFNCPSLPETRTNTNDRVPTIDVVVERVEPGP